MSYSPTLGRFLEQDPVGYTEDGNLYEFVGSNPVNETDPLGLYPAGFPGARPTDDPGPSYDPRELAKALKDLLPPEQQNCDECKKQADELANAIASAVASQPWQIGGGTGNLISGVTGVVVNPLHPVNGWNKGGWGNQCGDWQSLIQSTIKPLLDRYGDKSCFDAVTADGVSGRWTHNWVEISTPAGTIVIDPYPTGGSKIIDPSTATGYPNPTRTGIGNLPPPWSPRRMKPRKPPTSQPSSNPATCPCPK